MKKLEKLIVASSLMLIGFPLVANAEDVDRQIQQQTQRINEIKRESASIEAFKQKTEAEIQQLESEMDSILASKASTEQKVNKIASDIKELEEKIAKRKETLANQAREIQVSEPSNAMMTTLLDADSLGEAIQRAIASVTIMNASNSIVEQQQKDIETSIKLEKELEEKLSEIETHASELQQKQGELADVRLNQYVALADLRLSLNQEESKKSDLEADKAAAEKKREETLKQLAAEEALAAEAKKQAQAEEKKAQEQVEKEVVAETAASQEKESANETGSEVTTSANASEPIKEETSIEETSNKETNPEINSETPGLSSGKQTSGWSLPVDSVHISSRFGYRTDPTGSSGNQHNGIDFTGSSGTPIYAIQGGKVVEAGYGPSTGNYVIIKHPNGIYSYYMHFNALPAVSSGQSVTARQYLGGMGTTGNSTGVHLHLGMATGLWSGFFDPASELGL